MPKFPHAANVQIAKARGALVVATGSAGKRDFVTCLGANEFIDYAVAPFDRSITVLKPGGVLVTVVEPWDGALARRVREAAGASPVSASSPTRSACTHWRKSSTRAGSLRTSARCSDSRTPPKHTP